MGLALPLALLGLAWIALPIVAHLLRRRDVPRRELPTIALLRKAEVTSQRRARVVDRILLALRIATIALAAIALAAPFTTARLAYGDGRVASIAIVIDDSMSMSRRDGDATLVDRAVARASEITRALPAGSEVAVVLAGEPARVVLPRTTELGLVDAALSAAQPGTARGTDLAAAIRLASRQLSGARHPTRRVVLVSDLAGVTAEALERPADAALEIVDVGADAETANLAIVGLRSTADPLTQGGIALEVDVRAFGDPRERAAVLVRGAAGELARATLELREGAGRASLRFTAPPASDPALSVALELEVPDALSTDDARGLLVRAASAPRVLLVDGDPRPLARGAVGGSGEEVRFLARALRLAPAAEGSFELRAVDSDAVAGTAVDQSDVMVLANVTLTDAIRDRVRAHVAAGGGLLVTAGEHVEPGAYARLADVLAARIVAQGGEIVGMSEPSESDLLPPGTSGLASVRTSRRLSIEPEDGARAVLSFGDGAPALVLDEVRRTALLATSADDAWTDLPYHPGFLPLVVRTIRALAPPGAMPDAPFAPGHAPELRAPADVSHVVLMGPDGTLVEASIDQGLVDLSRAVAPGAWRVQMETAARGLTEAPRAAFVVAPDPSESDLRRTLDVASLASTGTARAVEATDVVRPLAPWAFLLVGLIAIAEGALRLRKKET